MAHTNIRNRIFKIASIFFALLAIAFLILCLPKVKKESKPGPIQGGESQNEAQTPTKPYKSPIDFKSLQKKNEDIYGWLEIPGTEISYPVLQHQEDDAFYLDHDDAGKYDVCGTLFTEHAYNKKDFSDPVVAIYGHHLKSGQMFGNLQQYYTDDFDRYNELIIYTPEEEIHYQVFAAVSFSNRHILYYYNGFKDAVMMKEFLSDINSVRAIGSYVDKTVDVATNDQLLVLSTCLQGDRTCRFLVVGKRIERAKQ